MYPREALALRFSQCDGRVLGVDLQVSKSKGQHAADRVEVAIAGYEQRPGVTSRQRQQKVISASDSALLLRGVEKSAANAGRRHTNIVATREVQWNPIA